MKILLVNPPNCGRSIPEEQYGIDSLKLILRGEPLSLEVLAGNLDSHEVRIIDLKADSVPFRDALSDFNPQIVGFTALTCEANTVLALASMTREMVSSTIVVGGVHATNDPDFFNKPGVDYIVVGLGKLSFAELVAALESGSSTETIPGIARTRPGSPLSIIPRTYSHDDLVEEKPPRYDLVSQYRDHYVLPTLGFKLGAVTAAYGCPHRCSFCCIEKTTGGRYLTSGAEAVVRDIRQLPDIPVIRLVDANTFGSATHARELCRKIAEAGLKKNYVADVRSDTVVHHADLFMEWKNAGLRSVIVGFEEIDDARLGEMGKESTSATNSEAIRILHEIGITVVGDFIISPDWDELRFKEMRAYLDKNPVDLPMFSVLTPLPGTALYESLKERITVHDLDFYTLTNAVFPTTMSEKAFYENYADLMKSGHAGAKL